MAKFCKQTTVKGLLALLAALLALDLGARMTATPVHAASTAQAAGIPDSGAQLQAVVDELKSVNRRLESMQSLMESGNMTVKTKAAEKDEK